MQTGALNFQQGDDRWHEYRRKCTEAVPGKFSALYWLNANVLGRSESVPMTYRAHWAMCMFAEGATGFPEIDQARVKMIMVPRGVGKSALITEALPIKLLLKNTDAAVGIANEISSNAEGFLGTIKQNFESNGFLRALWPDRVWRPDQIKKTTWASGEIVIPRTRPRQMSPSILATGVGGTVTGVHLDAWVIDDILSKNAAENARRGLFTEIESTNRWFTQLQPLLASPKRDPIWIIGCIAHDQPVLMADGTWKPIQDVSVGDEVWACKKHGKGGLAARRVTGVWPQGYANVLEVNVAGRRLVCTEDHPLLVSMGRKDGVGRQWKPAREFAREFAPAPDKRGALIEVFSGMPGMGKEPDLNLYWLLGFLWGDGWVTKCERPNGDLTYSVFFALGERGSRNRRAERLLNRYFAHLGGSCYRTPRAQAIRMDNTEAGRTLEEWGLTPGVRASGKRLPDWLFRSQWAGKRAFLQGLCHADGHKTAPRRWSFETASGQLAIDVHRLAMTCNVKPSSIYRAERTIQAPNSPAPTTGTRNTLCLNFERRRDETCRYGVRKVEQLAVQRPVYDLTIEDGDCAFVASGLLVGNTYWWVGDTYQWLEGTEEDPGLFGHGEKRQDYLWTLKLPDGTVQTLKLYRRGEMAVFRRPIRDETGRSWFPERLTDEELATMQAEDPYFFSSQYLLEPAAGGASAFRTEWLKHYSFA